LPPSPIETPPRAWRRPRLSRFAPLRPGNTSTCVEKTKSNPSWTTVMWKHLHVRGEDTNILLKSRYVHTRYGDYPPFRVSTISCSPEMVTIGLRGGPILNIS